MAIWFNPLQKAPAPLAEVYDVSLAEEGRSPSFGTPQANEFPPQPIGLCLRFMVVVGKNFTLVLIVGKK